MKHRLFIAINLPDRVKKTLDGYKRKWPELPAKWTSMQNLHITLEFLGYVDTKDIEDVIKTTRETAKKHSPFNIKLERISFGPSGKMPPRMVWAEGEKSKELGVLKDNLQQSLSDSQLRTENSRAFSPHITLGRIKAWGFKLIEPEERPEVNENISIDFEVESIEVMESRLKRGGPEYVVLESCQLQD
jgi:2'-5' RNA ligase